MTDEETEEPKSLSELEGKLELAKAKIKTTNADELAAVSNSNDALNAYNKITGQIDTMVANMKNAAPDASNWRMSMSVSTGSEWPVGGNTSGG